MLQKVTIAFFRTINGNIFPQSEDVLVDAPDGDSAAVLARQAHGRRLLESGAICETDEHGQQRIRAAVMGIEPASAADIERLTPKPEPVSEATKAGEDMPDGGPVIGVFEGAVVLQERAIRAGTRTDEPNDMKPKNKGGRPKGSKNRKPESVAA